VGCLVGLVGVVVGVVMVVDDDSVVVCWCVCMEVVMYFDVVGSFDMMVEVFDSFFMLLCEVLVCGDFEGVGVMILDELFDKFVIVGDFDSVVKYSVVLFVVGVSWVEFGMLYGCIDDEGVELIGCKVLLGLCVLIGVGL